MKIIQNENMPKSNGHYSQCIESNGLLFISGQLPIDPVTKEIPESIEQQTYIVLQKIQIILESAGSSISKVVLMRIYISNIELWDNVNKVYSEFFGEHKPVRCVIPVGKLHYGALIEAEAVAES